ncbi:4-hydroxy-3-methylbut-2-enyl diphosphate reductase [Bacteroidales bacterium OttesenSCG-928-B11]|nr:4-hydroxy-3-methylbut-2-enyl diphosphate reductase [Bacteroidales bacterium OttesenSCG-928-E04]MDL2312411.1 4-hydroxy-3-methylbut-2-enyl diphosphate reductase [Bacteroidales bacterium OttesenSCG-928-B11]MDL2326314.1 4-hydroxy-3-methylbut-2-enyl diphosphate reductase [Bacteroidales bacterium OttesenSCG-928-A14]
MEIAIDENSGFCFGVINAIQTAENYLQNHSKLYCLGDIVHNNEEVNRLTRLGLIVISHEQFQKLHDTTVLIRAHGEPPETYQLAERNNITLIDATCSVVLKLQQRIRDVYRKLNDSEGQILIFGKQGHAEVIGLLGQTEQNGLVISSIADIEKIDFSKIAILFAQTTQSLQDYYALTDEIKTRYQNVGNERLFDFHDTVCRSVANRSKQIAEFAKRFDRVIFVSGEKSSNGLYLYGICKANNPQTFFISNAEQVLDLPVNQDDSVGICGATSTPMWLMRKVEDILSGGE